MHCIIRLFVITSLVFWTAGITAQTRYSKAADEAFNDQMYLLALQKYQKAYSKVKNNKNERDRISFRIAECYRMMNNTKRSENAYKRLVTNVKYVKDNPRVILYYADALKVNGNYEEAIKQYQAYKELVPDDPKPNTGIETCTLSKEWVNNPTKYEVRLEKKINSREDDFAPAYADPGFNSILFTSNRAASLGKDLDNWTGLEFSDLFYARKDRKGDWSTPALTDESGTLNSKASEGACQLNSRFTNLYFTRCWNEPKKKNGCAIYKVNRVGINTWGDPQLVDLGGDSTFVFGHPSVTPDENALYFAAEIPGGYGGKDIWVARKKGKGGEWVKENLGPVINTPGDELFPFIRSDSVLYFSSNGHPGMGGMDIFRSVKSGGRWTVPDNLKSPINSHSDDFSIIFNPEEPEEGYFASNRPGGKGRDDIYSFVVPPVYFTLECIVIDDRSLQPLSGAKVTITGTNGKAFSDNTDDKGKYSFNKNQISLQTTYDILVTKKDYLNEKGRETTVGLEKSKDLVRDFALKPIPKKPVVLPDILYDLAKWDLKPQYQDSLQGLIETLDANETIVIELASHTDSRDTEERNDILSQKRAQSVVNYLISRGIDPDRLVAKGYGERVPRTIAKEMTREGYTFTPGTVLTDSIINLLPGTVIKEAAHQLNRRTEFTILRNDFIPKTTLVKAVQPKIEVVVNPEENNVPYSMTKEGYLEATCYVNGITMTFTYEPKEKECYISTSAVMKLLKDGVIGKEDFQGDPSKILGEGTVADKSVLNLKELRIGKNTVRDVKVTVNRKVAATLFFGENALKQFGSYSIDTQEGQIVFE